MKFKNIIRYTALALPVALLGGCTGDFEELNTNPIEVNPSDLPFEAQFLEPMSYSYPNQQNLFQYWTNLQIDIFGGYFPTETSRTSATTSTAATAAACTRTSCCISSTIRAA